MQRLSAKINLDSVIAATKSKTQEKTDEEYKILLALFVDLISDFYEDPELFYVHSEIMLLRATNLLNHAFSGYGKNMDDVKKLIKEKDTAKMSRKELDERNMFMGLIDNLISFAVAEEYQAFKEIQADAEESESEDEFEDMAIGTFAKYNRQYAAVENADVLFALGIASEYITTESEEIIEFKTQGDERVRASHAALDGLRYRKSEFPDALVPPIEWACRCYLVNTGSTDGRTLTNRSGVPALLAAASLSIFKNNVAKDGVMFSEDHPYFEVDSEHEKELADMTSKIKNTLFA